MYLKLVLQHLSLFRKAWHRIAKPVLLCQKQRQANITAVLVARLAEI
jgi:hypothetical protein